MIQEQELGCAAPEAPVGGQTANSLKLYLSAKECLGKTLVPAGDDPEYGCAISVNMLFLRTFGKQIGGGTSTYDLFQNLVNSPLFKEVQESEVQGGDIIISPTGMSSIPFTPITNGHVGVLGIYGAPNNGIMSNDSFNGLWQEVYTLASWTARYKIQGGYPMRFFRAL